MTIKALTIAVFAGIASASPIASTDIESLEIQNPADSPTTMLIDLSGFNSWDTKGSPFNESLVIPFPSRFQITGISWDLTIETIGGSWLSEPNIRLFNTDETGGFTFVPGIGFDNSGIMTFVGSIDLVASGDDFTTNTDNLLNIEIFESFDDFPGGIDALFQNGSSLTIHLKKVPAPGSLALLGLGGLVATRRRRYTTG